MDHLPETRSINRLSTDMTLSSISYKNPKCRKQKEVKVEAYFFIRKSLNALRRRGNWEFFNGLA